jgi:hypothetical protein
LLIIKKFIYNKFLYIVIIGILFAMLFLIRINKTVIPKKSPQEVNNKSIDYQIKFAKYLTRINVVLYTVYSCPHCHNQKQLFGKKASDQLNIVECAIDGKDNQYRLCQGKGINRYPSWEIYGKIYKGAKSLEQLAELSQYPEQFNQ